MKKQRVDLRNYRSLIANMVACQCLALVTIFVSIFVSIGASAIPEAGFEASYPALVQSFYQAHGQTGTLVGEKGRTLSYVKYIHPQAVANIVIVEGFGESYLKYDELAFDLYQQKFSVFIMDHRGQGSSEHLLDDANKGYIDRFDFLVSDLARFVQSVVPPQSVLPRFILAHSLGGAVTSRYLEAYPHEFRAAVLSSPMLSISFGHSEATAIAAVLGLEIVRGREHYAVTPQQNELGAYPFQGNSLTHSEARFNKNISQVVQHPEIFLGGQTLGWVSEAIRGSRKARSGGALVKIPVLLFQAEQDSIVTPEGQNIFCQATPLCRMEVIKGARHEIFQESDAARDQALREAITFFRAQI
jgi:lysophospholipase